MIKLAFPICSAIFIILSKKLGVSLLGPYKFIKVKICYFQLLCLKLCSFPLGQICAHAFYKLSFV